MATAATGGKVTTCQNCDKPEAYRRGRCLGPRDQTKPQCPVHGIPAHAWAVVTLYNRCQARGALPYPGGILDQPENLMRFFDVIDNEMERYRARKRRPAAADRPEPEPRPPENHKPGGRR